MDDFDSDRPSLDRASLERIERMRTRSVRVEPAPRPVLPWVLAACLLALALGLIANPWFERNIRAHLPGFAAETLPTSADVAAQRREIAALDARIKTLATVPATATAGAPINGERLMHAETRIDGIERSASDSAAQLDTLAQKLAGLEARVDATASATAATLATATQGAESAQQVLLLSMTRRQLEAGEKLTALEPQLQRNFGEHFAQPLAAVLALGNAPVTPRALRSQLITLKPALSSPAGADAGWWDKVTDSLSSLVRVRATGAPPSEPAERVDAALQALAQGSVAEANAQIAGLPAAPRAAAKPWLAAAGHYLAAQRGLATLESAALAPAAARVTVKP